LDGNLAQGLFSQPLGLKTCTARSADPAEKKNEKKTIIIIVIVNNFFLKKYYCRNFGHAC
jgi:hypothetical protein